MKNESYTKFCHHKLLNNHKVIKAIVKNAVFRLNKRPNGLYKSKSIKQNMLN